MFVCFICLKLIASDTDTDELSSPPRSVRPFDQSTLHSSRYASGSGDAYTPSSGVASTVSSWSPTPTEKAAMQATRGYERVREDSPAKRRRLNVKEELKSAWQAGSFDQLISLKDSEHLTADDFFPYDYLVQLPASSFGSLNEAVQASIKIAAIKGNKTAQLLLRAAYNRRDPEIDEADPLTLLQIPFLWNYNLPYKTEVGLLNGSQNGQIEGLGNNSAKTFCYLNLAFLTEKNEEEPEEGQEQTADDGKAVQYLQRAIQLNSLLAAKLLLNKIRFSKVPIHLDSSEEASPVMFDADHPENTANQLAELNQSNLTLRSYIFYQVGMIYQFEKGNLDTAEHYYKQGDEVTQSSVLYPEILLARGQLAQSQAEKISEDDEKQKKIKEAINFYKQAGDLGQVEGYKKAVELAYKSDEQTKVSSIQELQEKYFLQTRPSKQQLYIYDNLNRDNVEVISQKIKEKNAQIKSIEPPFINQSSEIHQVSQKAESPSLQDQVGEQ